MTKLGVDAALVGGELVHGDVEISNGRVQAVGVSSGGATGRIAAPGFLDLQVNGFAGIDFAAAEEDDLATASEALSQTGVTSFLPTLITGPLEEMIAQANKITSTGRLDSGAHVLGIHLEGPAINPALAGAHSSDHVTGPSAGLARKLIDDVADLRLVTLAPELEGALEMTRVLRDGGVTVSFGHTAATEVQALAGFGAGGTAVTHIFNAMRPINHREPGIAAAALTHPEVFIGLIADQLHIAPTILRLVAQLARDRIVLVTDACAGAACPDGDYTLGGERVTVVNGVARRPDGVLAGSTLTIPEAIRNLVDLQVPFIDAVGAASLAPWALLGHPGRAMIGPGAVADIVITDQDLEIHSTLIAGQTVYEQ